MSLSGKDTAPRSLFPAIPARAGASGNRSAPSGSLGARGSTTRKGTTMRNLRLPKDTASPRRLLRAATFGVAAVAAALVPAQAAARPQHHPEPAHARLECGALRVRGTEANDAIAL